MSDPAFTPARGKLLMSSCDVNAADNRLLLTGITKTQQQPTNEHQNH